jgi:hypothetical protein
MRGAVAWSVERDAGCVVGKLVLKFCYELN